MSSTKSVQRTAVNEATGEEVFYDEKCYSTNGKVLGRTRDWIMGRAGRGQGYLGRGLRFGGRRLKSTGISGLHAVKFGCETALYTTLIAGTLLVGNTLVNDSGPQIQFQGQEMVYSSHEDGDIIASVDGEDVRFMQSDRGTWLTQDLTIAKDQSFCDACDVYKKKMTDNPERNLSKPISYTPTWIPSIHYGTEL